MNTPSAVPRDRHLRVSTAQRELVLEVLRNAAAEERITFDELEGRVPRTLGAVTRADLAAVLDDLLPSTEVDEVVGAEPTLGEGPGYAWDDPLMIAGTGWGQKKVDGAWMVPPFLEVHSSIGGVRLDFTLAQPRSKVIDLVLVVNDWGTTTIIVPEGWGVDTQAAQAEVGYVETRGVRTRAQQGRPRIIVRGRTSGAVKIRVAKERDVRRAEQLAGQEAPALPRA